jgi:hypothetical protein
MNPPTVSHDADNELPKAALRHAMPRFLGFTPCKSPWLSQHGISTLEAGCSHGFFPSRVLPITSPPQFPLRVSSHALVGVRETTPQTQLHLRVLNDVTWPVPDTRSKPCQGADNPFRVWRLCGPRHLNDNSLGLCVHLAIPDTLLCRIIAL